jgi:Polyketide cyclase / dehydrase and lipid transport
MSAYKISRSITKSIDLRVTPARAFDFLSDPVNWPKWAIVNMKSVKSGSDGWYETETRQGKGQLKMLSNKALGLLDHAWKDPQASWTVPARVVPNGEGCTFLMTFFQPPVMDDKAFDAASKEVEAELTKLKEILERQTLTGISG